MAMKDRLGHGHFTPWIEAEFQWSARTAERYMEVAERFGAKTTSLSYLPLETTYRLAARSTPEPVVAEVLARAEAGNPLPRKAVEDLLWTERQKVKTAAAEAKLSEKQRRRREASKRQTAQDDEAAKARWEIEHERRQEAAERAAALLTQNLSKEEVWEFISLTNKACWPIVEAALKNRVEAETPAPPPPFKERRAGRPMTQGEVDAAFASAEARAR